MARALRIQYPGAFYHVTSRGNEQTKHGGYKLHQLSGKEKGTWAARHLGVTRKTLSALINCKAAMSPEMAVRIGKATKTSPESWLYMQAKLDLWNAQRKPAKVEVFKRIAA